MQQAQYLNVEIKSVEALAMALEIPINELIDVAQRSDAFYRPNPPQIKPNGKIRQTYCVLQPLKRIQEKIKNYFFWNVKYPDYLMGSIKDWEMDRGYIQDARIHTGSYVIIHEDICDFFPSIKSSNVDNMWQFLFKFPPEITKILTKLTTHNNFLPQGAKTSSYIANLIFWDKEPQLVEHFQNQDLVYTRYIDDFQISSKRRLEKTEIEEIIKNLYQMIFSYGFKPNRKKHENQNKAHKITVHNLNINSGRPTMPRKSRSKIRSAVHEIEQEIRKRTISDGELSKKLSKIIGRLDVMAQFHPKEAKQYRLRLETIIISQNNLPKTSIVN